MELHRESIEFNPETRNLRTSIAIMLEEPNGMLLKAKAELYADVLDAVSKIINAKQAEFEEIYGSEVSKHVHFGKSIDEDVGVTMTPRKTVYSHDVQKRLLDRAFREKSGGTK